ncbi:U32 family peptidase [Halosquirtibacter laminarini]|uniref:U32 family peptidase n=1 Tax=Halosquirtibacter laminarini TaxID=3374600 RepID=A0AC61ND44_9BACT|nr:U32 family peptidase [Prolixibacteraceae bacterium]
MLIRDNIELLAPAKNLEYGKVAFDYGADAVYIGGPSFGARANAGNSISDIESLVRYAHRFDGDVFMALNTILFDHELEEAHRIIWQAYNAGVDALIIQDMGILEMDLPPISLHASTQTNNFTLEKVQFLEKVGFDRVVLARELSLTEIQDIAENTNVSLEAFIHGALCVSLSGQCYMSAFNGARSANRGACVQSCRKAYSLYDSKGECLVDNKYLLSLKDMNQTNSLKDIVESGVQSLKIEGRLKDINYLKNSVGHYRRELDQILEGSTKVRASVGKTTFDFTPDPKKSFSRDFTSYFLNEKQPSIANLETPKSLGELVGTVKLIGKSNFTLEGSVQISNNDGLVVVHSDGTTEGVKVNVAENNTITPLKMPRLNKKDMVYRNYNHGFLQSLEKSRTSRKRGVDILISEEKEFVEISFAVDSNRGVEYTFESTFEFAKNEQVAQNNIQKQLSKLGDTPFFVSSFTSELKHTPFIPNKILGNVRRELAERLVVVLESERKVSRNIETNDIPYIEDIVDYRANVANQLAVDFYKRHQTKVTEMAFESHKKNNSSLLMQTRYCILNEIGQCLKKGFSLDLPLKLVDSHHEYQLSFDCKNCSMQIYS